MVNLGIKVDQMLSLKRNPIKLATNGQGGYSTLPPFGKQLLDSLSIRARESDIYSFLGWESSGSLTFGNEVTAQLPMALEQYYNIHPIFLNADVHAYLNGKGTWDQIAEYSKTMKEQASKLFPLAKIIDGSDFQLGTKDFKIDIDEFSKKVEGLSPEDQHIAFVEKLKCLNDKIKDDSRRTNFYRRTYLDVLKLPRGELDGAVSEGVVSKNAEASGYIYAGMQIADIHYFTEFENVKVFTGGTDQLKIHSVAYDNFRLKYKWKVPFFIHAPMLPYLGGETDKMNPQRLRKMSKSEGLEHTLFLNDSESEIREKISKAFCPTYSTTDLQEVKNPVVDLIKLVINPHLHKIKVERPFSKGGPIEKEPMEIIELYKRNNIHPQDLKNAVADSMVRIVKQIGLPTRN